MTLLSTEVEVKLASKNIPHYEALGYDIPRRRRSTKRAKNDLTVPVGTAIMVKVEHLPKGAHTEVEIQCEYCNKKFTKKYFKYINQNEKSEIKKDCCEECRHVKTKELMNLKYGVDNNTQIPKVREQMSERRREDEDTVNKKFEDIGYIKLSGYKSYSEPIEFICKKHEDKGIQITTYSIAKNYDSGCKYCRYEKISGENCHLWKGGITTLSIYLRTKIEQWRRASFSYHGSKCVITGNKNNLILHHLYPFANIVKEIVINLNMDIRDEISMYSNEELNKLEEECLRLHFEYEYGVPLLEKLHILFHSIYGNENTTKEQFEEFKIRYKNGNGEFKGVI